MIDFFFNACAYRTCTGQQGLLMYPLEQQTTPWIEKISSRGPSAVPAFSPRKFPTCRTSHWSLPAPPYTNTVQATGNNGPANLTNNKKLKQMQYWQTLSNDSYAKKPTKGGVKQNKNIHTCKTLNAYFYQYIN